MSEFVIKDSDIEGTYESHGKLEHWFDDEKALAVLLSDEVIFSNGREFVDYPYKPKADAQKTGWQVEPDRSKPQINPETVVLFVNCNDVFYWGTADAESLPHSEIEHLYKLWKENPKYGADKWCCLRRKLRPQVPLVKMMKDDNYWDADLEALPAPEPS